MLKNKNKLNATYPLTDEKYRHVDADDLKRLGLNKENKVVLIKYQKTSEMGSLNFKDQTLPGYATACKLKRQENKSLEDEIFYLPSFNDDTDRHREDVESESRFSYVSTV